jgi:prepilin peptidase CpaA
MELLLSIVVVLASCCAAYTDVASFKVRNKLTFPLAVGGILFHGFFAGSNGLLLSLSGLGLGFGLLILPYAVGALGAGDVKFFAAIGAWIGPAPLVNILLIGCICTGIFSAAIILRERGIAGIYWNMYYCVCNIAKWFHGGQLDTPSVQEINQTENRRGRLVPFSAMLSIGIVSTVIWQTLVTRN